jgi:N-acetylmuramoyl-L-alanine amidase
MKLRIIILYLILKFVIVNLHAKEVINANNAQIILDNNKIFSKVVVYKSQLSKMYYFPIKLFAKIYNGKVTYNNKRTATLYLKNIKIILQADSNKVIIGNKTNIMSKSSKQINNEMYIPCDLLLLKDFAKITATNINWSPHKLQLSIEHLPNIMIIEYCLNLSHTRVSLHCKQSLRYTILKRTSTNLIIKILNGKVPKNSFITINDGIIKCIEYKNLYNNVIMKISLKTVPKHININTYKNKININITHYNSIPSNNSQKTYHFTETSKILFKPKQEINNTLLHIKPQKKKVIVIDAGHGGKDSGAIGCTGTKEKDINLLIAKELKKLFEKHTIYKIILTRDNDIFLTLLNRTQIANNANAALFISIHCNASNNVNIKGFEIYFLSEQNDNKNATAIRENNVIKFEDKTNAALLLKQILHSIAINKYINDAAELCSFINMGIKNTNKLNTRGVKQANFYVLRGVKMPAILVESAFLSNHSQEIKLNSRKFRNMIANIIYKGVINYYKYIERKIPS